MDQRSVDEEQSQASMSLGSAKGHGRREFGADRAEHVVARENQLPWRQQHAAGWIVAAS
jgi:hypothetical protein